MYATKKRNTIIAMRRGRKKSSLLKKCAKIDFVFSTHVSAVLPTNFIITLTNFP